MLFKLTFYQWYSVDFLPIKLKLTFYMVDFLQYDQSIDINTNEWQKVEDCWNPSSVIKGQFKKGIYVLSLYWVMNTFVLHCRSSKKSFLYLSFCWMNNKAMSINCNESHGVGWKEDGDWWWGPHNFAENPIKIQEISNLKSVNLQSFNLHATAKLMHFFSFRTWTDTKFD